MPISSGACPAGAPAVTSLRPSRLATRVAGAAVASPGTVIPAGGVRSLLADDALMPSVPIAAAAAMPAPIPQARRRFVLLIMLIVLPEICGRCLAARPPWTCTQSSGPAPQPGHAEKLTAIWVNRIRAAYVARRADDGDRARPEPPGRISLRFKTSPVGGRRVRPRQSS